MTSSSDEILNPHQVIIDSHVHLMPSARYFAREFVADLQGGHHIAASVLVECGAGYDGATLDFLALQQRHVSSRARPRQSKPPAYGSEWSVMPTSEPVLRSITSSTHIGSHVVHG